MALYTASPVWLPGAPPSLATDTPTGFRRAAMASLDMTSASTTMPLVNSLASSQTLRINQDKHGEDDANCVSRATLCCATHWPRPHIEKVKRIMTIRIGNYT